MAADNNLMLNKLEEFSEFSDSGNNLTINRLDIEFTDPDTTCGIGSFRPKWLQKYATAKNYLILYSVIGVLQGSYFSYLIGIISTLEKRYAFKGKTSGAIMMMDEFSPLILGVFVGYFGGRMHKPRLLAVGTYLSVVCCFISSLPYFFYGESRILTAHVLKNETRTEYCDFSPKTEDCVETGNTTVTAVACLFLGSFMKGFGNVTFYAVGMAYLDDNTEKKNTPIYFGTTQTLRLFGPILGFLMSSAFLKYYENPFGDPGFGPEDPRWIGAWWIGFILQGVLLAIVTTPLVLFPRRLPTQRSRALSNTRNFEKENNWERIMGMFKALKRLMKNPVYFFFALGTIFNLIGTFGLFILIPKYTEIQFGASASEASLFSGPPALIGMQITVFLGGWIIWKWKPTAKQLVIGHAAVEVFWACSIFILMIPDCTQLDMRGTTLTETGLDITNECNIECLCSKAVYSPVCGPDEKSWYFSPCYAGCEHPEYNNASIIHGCSCLYNSSSSTTTYESSVKTGVCKSNSCNGQKLMYLILFPVLCSLASILSVGHNMILLRSIEPQDKSVALGLFEAVLSAFGFLPYPMIFGALTDSACLIWESSCGKTGNCWFYDVHKFKNLIHGVAGAFALLSSICFIIICRMYNRIQDLYIDDDEHSDHKK